MINGLNFWLRNSCRNAPEQKSVKRGNLPNRCRRHVPASTRCHMPSKQISKVSEADFGCFMRVAHRKAPDYGIYGLLELLANFWQNRVLMTSPRKGKSENRRVFIGIWMVGLGGL